MIAPLPYANLVGSHDPLALLATTPDRIAELVQSWDANRWGATYAPGKWTAAQIILHLAQDEIGWSNRIRRALSGDGYVVQAYDADRWITWETPTEPQTALAAFLALRRLNLILYRRISLAECSRLLVGRDFNRSGSPAVSC